MRYLLALTVCLLSFTGTALAASATVAVADAATDGSLLDLAKPVLEAVRSGNGWLAAALALVLLVAAARRYGADKLPWLGSKAGGAFANLLLSFGGMASTALAAGTAPSWALALTALKVSFTAAIGFEFAKELAAPTLRWIESKIPATFRPAFSFVLKYALWAFEKRDPAAVARGAGEAAVKASPGKGAEAVVEIEDLR